MEENLLNDDFSLENLLANWQVLTHTQRMDIFVVLGRVDQEELFINLACDYQAEIFDKLRSNEKRTFIRLLAPDDIADLVQMLEEEEQKEALHFLDYATLVEVKALMAYAEDEAGGLMN